MKLNKEQVLNLLGEKYRAKKLAKGYELQELPEGIISDQIKVVVEFFIEEINKLNKRIKDLEKK